MRMFSIAIRTGINAGAILPAGMEKVTGLIQSIEFEPNECANLRRGCGDEFSEELA
jgi:hypothetical protein